MQCTVCESGALLMALPDDSRLLVPLQHVQRSSTLQEAVSSTSDAQFTFTTPAGFVQLWHDAVAQQASADAKPDTTRMAKMLLVRTLN